MPGDPQLAARESLVELRVDVRRDVDAVDDEVAAAALDQRGIVDLQVMGVDPTHHHRGEVGGDEPRPRKRHVVEARALQVVGPAECCCHRCSLHPGALAGSLGRVGKFRPYYWDGSKPRAADSPMVQPARDTPHGSGIL
jgi:hypothetical protein